MFVFSVATYNEYENREEVTFVSYEPTEIDVLHQYAEWRRLANIVFGKKRSVILFIFKVDTTLENMEIARKRLDWNNLDRLIVEIKSKHNLQ